MEEQQLWKHRLGSQAGGHLKLLISLEQLYREQTLGRFQMGLELRQNDDFITTVYNMNNEN